MHGDKSFMTFWHEDWSPRKSSEAPASSESLKDQIVPSRSAPELPAAALQAQESPTGALSNKSMRSTNSGGAEFELALLRRECDGLRRPLTIPLDGNKAWRPNSELTVFFRNRWLTGV